MADGDEPKLSREERMRLRAAQIIKDHKKVFDQLDD